MTKSFLGDCLCNLVAAGAFIAGCTILLVTAFPIVQIAIGAFYMYECPAAPMVPVFVMGSGVLALVLMGLFALPKLLCPAAPGNKIWTVWVMSLLLFAFTWFIYGSYVVYAAYPPNYTKITVDPNRTNNTINPLTASDRLLHSLENQTLSNQTHKTDNNQSLLQLIQTLSFSGTSRQHLNASHPHGDLTVVPYCDRTLYLFAFWTTTLVYVFAGDALVLIICLWASMKIAQKLTECLQS